MNNEPEAGMNLDPEMLAAYIDKRLTPEQRTDVEAQLAKDPDSYAVLVESLKTLDARGEASRSEASRVTLVQAREPMDRRRWTLAVGALAAAAVLVLVIRLPIRSLIEPDDGIQRLARAVSDQRPTEGRLAEFPYGRRPVTTRSGGAAQSDLTLLSTAALVRDRATGSSPATLHERGVALLILGAHDDSIAALKAATEQSPENEQYWSDLAAAFLERWRTAANAQDARDGAVAARQALSINPSSLPALFNLALAAEVYELPDVASEAWERYLKMDPSSGWAEEAKGRIARLRSLPSGR